MKADIKALFAKIAAKLNLIGTYYEASWKASSSSTFGTVLTNSIALPAGTYVITLSAPVINVAFSYAISGISSRYFRDYASSSMAGSTFTIVQKFTSSTTIKATAAASASVSFTYTERGGLSAVRIA